MPDSTRLRYILRCRFRKGAASFFIMKSCVFFGHRDFFYDRYEDRILNIITDLIENKGVTQFYSGYRGDFDRYCSYLVNKLKNKYPYIKITMALSYIPDEDFELPACFDDSVYLLERKVPKRLAIIETNKRLADIADYVVAGVGYHGGGAYTAIEYAYKKHKPIVSIIEGWEV